MLICSSTCIPPFEKKVLVARLAANHEVPNAVWESGIRAFFPKHSLHDSVPKLEALSFLISTPDYQIKIRILIKVGLQ